MNEEKEMNNETNKDKDFETVGELDQDLETEEESLKDKLKKMKEELKACKNEKMEYLTGWQRAKADFINSRKDEEKRLASAVRFTEESALKDFLTIIDSFELAFKSNDWDNIDKKWKNGVENIYGGLQSVLKKYKIESIKAEGERFNPVFHEAIETEDVGDSSRDHIVLKELQKGYIIDGRVIRASKVKVGIFKS